MEDKKIRTRIVAAGLTVASLLGIGGVASSGTSLEASQKLSHITMDETGRSEVRAEIGKQATKIAGIKIAEKWFYKLNGKEATAQDVDQAFPGSVQATHQQVRDLDKHALDKPVQTFNGYGVKIEKFADGTRKTSSSTYSNDGSSSSKEAAPETDFDRKLKSLQLPDKPEWETRGEPASQTPAARQPKNDLEKKLDSLQLPAWQNKGRE